MAIKVGSHLSAPEYCRRYRPAARSRETRDSSSSHIGFRIVLDIVRPSVNDYTDRSYK